MQKQSASEMLLFNNLISHHQWVDLPFHGHTFTWSNMQVPPLLVKLDWVFCTATWLQSFPNTVVHPLPRPISDHVPYVLQISSGIPRAQIFRFENFLLDFASFVPTVN